MGVPRVGPDFAESNRAAGELKSGNWPWEATGYRMNQGTCAVIIDETLGDMGQEATNENVTNLFTTYCGEGLSEADLADCCNQWYACVYGCPMANYWDSFYDYPAEWPQTRGNPDRWYKQWDGDNREGLMKFEEGKYCKPHSGGEATNSDGEGILHDQRYYWPILTCYHDGRRNLDTVMCQGGEWPWNRPDGANNFLCGADEVYNGTQVFHNGAHWEGER
jgi:hypothetical protein